MSMISLALFGWLGLSAVMVVLWIVQRRTGDAGIVEMRDSYEARRNYIHQALNDMGLTCHLPRGAFYAFPNVTGTGIPSKVL